MKRLENWDCWLKGFETPCLIGNRESPRPTNSIATLQGFVPWHNRDLKNKKSTWNSCRVI